MKLRNLNTENQKHTKIDRKRSSSN